MPKVMHINCACTGSTGKIISDIADYAAQKGFESVLCAPTAPGNNPNIRYFRTSFPHEQGVYYRLNFLYGFQYGIAPVSTVRIKHIIRREKPDVIHLHCLNGFMVNIYSLFRFIKKLGIPTVITNHAEFYYTGNCSHAYECEQWMTGCNKCPRESYSTGGRLWKTAAMGWNRMKDAFMGWERVVMVSVSSWVGGRASASPIVKGVHQAIVENGVNTEVFAYRESSALREKYGFSADTKIIFHPTAHFSALKTDSKGGRYLIELAKALVHENIVILVAGRHAEGMEVPDNMILLGMVSDQKVLAEYYALADLTVTTSQRETFSMPVAESLCCGTPIVGFCAGGPESVAMPEYSKFVKFGDLEALQNAIVREWLQFKTPERSLQIAQAAAERYSREKMAKQYIQLYAQVLTDRSK